MFSHYNHKSAFQFLLLNWVYGKTCDVWKPLVIFFFFLNCLCAIIHFGLSTQFSLILNRINALNVVILFANMLAYFVFFLNTNNSFLKEFAFRVFLRIWVVIRVQSVIQTTCNVAVAQIPIIKCFSFLLYTLFLSLSIHLWAFLISFRVRLKGMRITDESLWFCSGQSVCVNFHIFHM